MLEWSEGWHRGVPKDEYLAVPAASSSRLKKLSITPAHLRSYLDQPPPSPEHFIVGDAGHAATLEPKRFKRDFVAAGPCVAEKQSGPKAGESCGNDGKVLSKSQGWLCGVHAKNVDDPAEGSLVLTAEDHAMCVIWQHRCWEHPILRPLLEAGGECEIVGLVTDEQTGVRMKGMIDFLPRTEPIEVDLKSTSAPLSHHSFAKECAKYGYDLQGALYRRLARQLGSPGDVEYREDRIIVALSKRPPYLIRVFRMARQDIDIADDRATDLLMLYGDCMRQDLWPGYPPIVETLHLPSWHHEEE